MEAAKVKTANLMKRMKRKEKLAAAPPPEIFDLDIILMILANLNDLSLFPTKMINLSKKLVGNLIMKVSILLKACVGAK